MPYTTKAEQALQGYLLGGTNPSIPGTYYAGLGVELGRLIEGFSKPVTNTGQRSQRTRR